MEKQPDNKMAPDTPRKHEDARRPMRAPNFGANYGPSASYTPATDNLGGYAVPDRSDSYPDPVGE